MWMYASITFHLDMHWRIQISTKEDRLIFYVVFELANELTTGKRIREGSLTLDESIFGWIVSGSVQLLSRRNDNRVLQAKFVSQESDLVINRFWTVDDLPSNRSPRSKAEEFVENHFDQNNYNWARWLLLCYFAFETNFGTFGECRANALKPFFSLERKLKQDVVLYTQYRDLLKDFRDMVTQKNSLKFCGSVGATSTCLLCSHGRSGLQNNDFKTARGCCVRPCIKLSKLPVSVEWTWLIQGGRQFCLQQAT